MDCCPVVPADFHIGNIPSLNAMTFSIFGFGLGGYISTQAKLFFVLFWRVLA
jgi:predicted unusual protein kinase regulating ubiquinone biosynthesis (AarF/ABC1/UbiB family)